MILHTVESAVFHLRSFEDQISKLVYIVDQFTNRWIDVSSKNGGFEVICLLVLRFQNFHQEDLATTHEDFSCAKLKERGAKAIPVYDVEMSCLWARPKEPLANIFNFKLFKIRTFHKILIASCTLAETANLEANFRSETIIFNSI